MATTIRYGEWMRWYQGAVLFYLSDRWLAAAAAVQPELRSCADKWGGTAVVIDARTRAVITAFKNRDGVGAIRRRYAGRSRVRVARSLETTVLDTAPLRHEDPGTFVLGGLSESPRDPRVQEGVEMSLKSTGLLHGAAPALSWDGPFLGSVVPSCEWPVHDRGLIRDNETRQEVVVAQTSPNGR